MNQENHMSNGAKPGAGRRTKARVIDRPSRYTLGKYQVTCSGGTIREVTAENRDAAIRRAERGIEDFKALAMEAAPNQENATPQPCADPTHAQYRATSSSDSGVK